jgi:hypothetical protein
MDILTKWHPLLAGLASIGDLLPVLTQVVNIFSIHLLLLVDSSTYPAPSARS